MAHQPEIWSGDVRRVLISPSRYAVRSTFKLAEGNFTRPSMRRRVRRILRRVREGGRGKIWLCGEAANSFCNAGK